MQRFQSDIYQLLMGRFDDSEIRTLCFNLGVDYDVLRGSGKSDKARELITYLDRRNGIPDLVSVGREMRPDIDWEISGARSEKIQADSIYPEEDISRIEPVADLWKTALLRLGHPVRVYQRPDLEKQILDYVLEGRHPVTLIQGLPGSGKTILLGELVRNIHPRYPNLCTIKFAGPYTMEPAYFLEELNQFLTRLNYGVDQNTLKNQDIRRSLQSISEQLSRLDHAMLLLDAVDQAPVGLIDLLLELLPQVRMVMTARSRVIPRSKAQFLNVPPFQDKEVREFFKLFASLEGNWNEDGLDKIPKSIKESPLMLALFIANLQDVPLELLLMDGIDGITQHPSTLIYNLIHGLNDETLRILSMLLLLENLDLPASLKALGIAPPRGLVEALQQLLGKSLIYRQGDAYRIPSQVREAAVEAIPSIINDVVHRMGQAVQAVTAALQTEKQYNQSAVLAPITANFILHLSELNYYDWIIKLATEEYVELINQQGFWKEYRLILRIAFEAAKQSNNPAMIALAGFRIVRKAFQVRDLQTGRNALTEVEILLDVVNGTTLHADLLSHKALFTEQDGNVDAALKELQNSLQIHRSLGNTRNISTVLNLIGNIHLRQRDIPKARQSFALALAQFGEEQVSSKQGLEVQTSLAICDFVERNLDEAQVKLRGIIEKCRGTGYLAGLPRTYYFLAMVLDMKNQHDEALHFAKLAAELALKSEQTIATGALMLVWKIKAQSHQER